MTNEAHTFAHRKCPVSSWRGPGESPAKNLCQWSRDHVGHRHRDGYGNTFDADGNILSNGRPYRP